MISVADEEASKLDKNDDGDSFELVGEASDEGDEVDCVRCCFCCSVDGCCCSFFMIRRPCGAGGRVAELLLLVVEVVSTLVVVLVGNTFCTWAGVGPCKEEIKPLTDAELMEDAADADEEEVLVVSAVPAFVVVFTAKAVCVWLPLVAVVAGD